jgi:hypothetical protein
MSSPKTKPRWKQCPACSAAVELQVLLLPIFLPLQLASQAMDQSSSISDPVNPFNYRLTRALSAWDLTHNLVATYRYDIPFERLALGPRVLRQG